MKRQNRSLRRSLTDFQRHPWLHFISIATITVALVILGAFFLCYRNFELIAEKSSPNITGTLYLKDALTMPEVESLRDRLLSQQHVVKAVFKSKKNVAEELQEFLGANPGEVLPGSELFPDVVELELRKETSPSAITVLKSIVGKFPEVSEVDFSEDWLAQYKKVRQLVTYIGIALMIGLMFGCGFIIANFMGMRHQSRREEIEIVNLIGANRRFILTPFIWEGVIEGIIGSTAALILLFFGKTVVSSLLSANWSSLLGTDSWLFLSLPQLMAVILIGVAMALFGGFTVFLRFQERSH